MICIYDISTLKYATVLDFRYITSVSLQELKPWKFFLQRQFSWSLYDHAID
jgi:hypothetical protein